MKKPIKIPFSQWKDKSKNFAGLPVHVSFDGNTQKVTVSLIKPK